MFLINMQLNLIT